MPTHFHLILNQKKENGIPRFMSNVLNSYTRYFNTKYKRKGPLWEGRFKGVRVQENEYLLHLTRYIHLNPVSASLVNKPEAWSASSYNEYIGTSGDRVTDFQELIDMNPSDYRGFVEERIDQQRELEKIKHLILE